MYMKKKTSLLDVVKYFYVYFFSAVGTIMILMGVYQYGEYLFNSYVGPEYRLDTYKEEQCDYLSGTNPRGGYPTPESVPETDAKDESTVAEKQAQYETCLDNLSEERAYQQKRDLFNASMLSGLGLIVFAIHFGWMRNKFL